MVVIILYINYIHINLLAARAVAASYFEESDDAPQSFASVAAGMYMYNLLNDFTTLRVIDQLSQLFECLSCLALLLGREKPIRSGSGLIPKGQRK